MQYVPKILEAIDDDKTPLLKDNETHTRWVVSSTLFTMVVEPLVERLIFICGIWAWAGIVVFYR